MDFSGEVNSLSRVPVTEKISWAELHGEWDTREDKVRGNILLHYYSPDTKLFKNFRIYVEVNIFVIFSAGKKQNHFYHLQSL